MKAKMIRAGVAAILALAAGGVGYAAGGSGAPAAHSQTNTFTATMSSRRYTKKRWTISVQRFSLYSIEDYFNPFCTFSNSTSKMSVEFAGMTFPTA